MRKFVMCNMSKVHTWKVHDSVSNEALSINNFCLHIVCILSEKGLSLDESVVNI